MATLFDLTNSRNVGNRVNSNKHWPGSLGSRVSSGVRILDVRTSVRHLATIVTLGVLCISLTACGGGGPSGPSTTPGSTATDTAKAYIAAWEANDGAAIDALLTPDAKSFWSMGGGPTKWLAGRSQQYGSPVPGKGRVLQLDEQGGSAKADVAVIYDCHKQQEPGPGPGTACGDSGGSGESSRTGSAQYTKYVPEWVPAGNAVAADHLTMQKQPDGKWLITYVEASSYLTNIARSTKLAVGYTTSTAQAVSYGATSTAYVVSQEATKAAVPTETPTPAPVHVTVKSAYAQGDIARRVREWSSDAILFRVFDRTPEHNRPFDYNPAFEGMGRSLDYFTDGDGTSRQWLFWAASPGKKEVKVWRVFDGKLQREDVSAKLYRDLFAAQAVTPKPLDLYSYIDSDQVVRLAREHGYKTDDLSQMYVQLASEDLSKEKYTPSDPAWNVVLIWAFTYKAILLNPTTGEVLKNDF